MLKSLFLLAPLIPLILGATIPILARRKSIQKRCRPRPQVALAGAIPSAGSGDLEGMQEVDVIHVDGGLPPQFSGQVAQFWGGQGNDHQHGHGNNHHDGGGDGQSWGGDPWIGKGEQTFGTGVQTQTQTTTRTTATSTETHTQSQKPPPPPPQPSTSQSGGGGAVGGDAQGMVQHHNSFRAQYGEYHHQCCAHPTDANPVGWSDELATYAANYASKCAFEHSSVKTFSLVRRQLIRAIAGEVNMARTCMSCRRSHYRLPC